MKKNSLKRSAIYFTSFGKTLQNRILSLSDIIWKAHDHSELEQKVNPNRHRFEFTPTNPYEVLAIIKDTKRAAS